MTLLVAALLGVAATTTVHMGVCAAFWWLETRR